MGSAIRTLHPVLIAGGLRRLPRGCTWRGRQTRKGCTPPRLLRRADFERPTCLGPETSNAAILFRSPWRKRADSETLIRRGQVEQKESEG